MCNDLERTRGGDEAEEPRHDAPYVEGEVDGHWEDKAHSVHREESRRGTVASHSLVADNGHTAAVDEREGGEEQSYMVVALGLL